MFQCHQCSKQFELFSSLSKHIGRIHNIHASQSYIEYILNGVSPKCECGCGKSPAWRNGNFQRFVNGHNSRGERNPMFGTRHSEESRIAMSKTRKEKFVSGKTHMWSEGLHIKTSKKLQLMAQKISENTDRAKKISKALHDRLNRTPRPFSELELIMMELLQKANIPYTSQFSLGTFFYDFHISNTNILIETDGNFYHCNPKTHPTPIYEIQKKNLINDKNKTEYATNHGYTLLRFWESDILNDSQKIVKELLAVIGKSTISTI